MYPLDLLRLLFAERSCPKNQRTADQHSDAHSSQQTRVRALPPYQAANTNHLQTRAAWLWPAHGHTQTCKNSIPDPLGSSLAKSHGEPQILLMSGTNSCVELITSSAKAHRMQSRCWPAENGACPQNGLSRQLCRVVVDWKLAHQRLYTWSHNKLDIGALTALAHFHAICHGPWITMAAETLPTMVYLSLTEAALIAPAGKRGEHKIPSRWTCAPVTHAVLRTTA